MSPHRPPLPLLPWGRRPEPEALEFVAHNCTTECKEQLPCEFKEALKIQVIAAEHLGTLSRPYFSVYDTKLTSMLQ